MPLKPDALTTLERVKNRLEITHANSDALIQDAINEATGFIQTYCNRRFVKQSYTDEIYDGTSPAGATRQNIQLSDAPIQSFSKAEYDAGTNKSPNWQAFDANWYDYRSDIGVVILYVPGPSGIRNLRFSYEAGYLVDFGNDSDSSKHTLPFEISGVCEQLAVTIFQNKQNAHRESVTFSGSSITLSQHLNDYDHQILSNYARNPLS